MSGPAEVTFAEVEAAARRIAGHAVVTPLIESPALDERLEAAGTKFIIPPQVRFKGQAGEQATMFFLDPSGNALEFKAFADDGQVFAK